MNLPHGVEKIGIHIGGVFASRKPAVVHTVLGSCVAACLYDPQARIGGMNHFFLPDSNGDAQMPTRYGVHAMETLINRIMQLGGDRRRMRAKVFGGARVLDMKGSVALVGDRNALFVKRFLEDERIPVLGERLGGTEPLKVLFFTDSARALVKAVPRQAAAGVGLREQRRAAEWKKVLVPPVENDVTLF